MLCDSRIDYIKRINYFRVMIFFFVLDSICVVLGIKIVLIIVEFFVLWLLCEYCYLVIDYFYYLV